MTGGGAGTLGILRVRVRRRMTFLNPQATSRQQQQQPPTELVPDTVIEPALGTDRAGWEATN